MEVSVLKTKVRQLVGQPVPADIMESFKWDEISGLSGSVLEQRLSGIASTIRENINGCQNPDNVLLG